MKARIATVLSLTGVLVAGSAAALVNTQVLGASSKPDGGEVTFSLDATSTTVATTLGGTTIVPSTTMVDTTVAAVSTQAVYQIGEAGFVTLDTAGQVLTIVSAVPNAGWLVTEAKSEDALNIEVKYQSATTEIEFHANLLFGVVGTSVETKSLVQQSDSGGSVITNGNLGATGTTGTTYTDDNDDEAEHEDHDDEDHGDDHEGDDD